MKVFQVLPSPFNPVKLQVGIFLWVGILLIIALSFLHIPQIWQLLLLLVYGVSVGGLICWRTRRILYDK